MIRCVSCESADPRTRIHCGSAVAHGLDRGARAVAGGRAELELSRRRIAVGIHRAIQYCAARCDGCRCQCGRAGRQRCSHRSE